MIVIKELKLGKKSIYEISYVVSNNIILSSNTYIYPIHKSTINNFDWFIFYDDSMLPITTVFRFINYSLSSQSFNSREKSMYAIRLLYIFMKIFNIKINELNKTNIEKLCYFLSGYSPLTGEMQIHTITKRSNETVNGYLSIYRSYLLFLNIKDGYLFETRTTNKIKFNPISDTATKSISYKSSKQSGNPFDYLVSKYITVSEYSSLVALTRRMEFLLGECIINLMYEYGLRLGEVLGLTFEDVKEVKKGNLLTPVVIIRNRISDNKDQKAKTCMNIVAYDQYLSVEYKSRNMGYQEVIISYYTYELINNYIDLYHSRSRQNNMQRYVKNVTADTVEKNKGEANYYVFLNSWGNRLTSSVWNRHLRQMFTEIGIPVDNDKRKNNLNHRFRHGFAMFHVLELKTKILELQRLMRHRSLISTMVYYNPSEQDKIEKLNAFVGDAFKHLTEE